jgi:hypothetical protein
LSIEVGVVDLFAGNSSSQDTGLDMRSGIELEPREAVRCCGDRLHEKPIGKAAGGVTPRPLSIINSIKPHKRGV